MPLPIVPLMPYERRPMSTFHPTPEQIIDWWAHRLADLRDNQAAVERELADAPNAAPDWQQMMADRLMRSRNDIVEVQRVLGEWKKIGDPGPNS